MATTRQEGEQAGSPKGPKTIYSLKKEEQGVGRERMAHRGGVEDWMICSFGTEARRGAAAASCYPGCGRGQRGRRAVEEAGLRREWVPAAARTETARRGRRRRWNPSAGPARVRAERRRVVRLFGRSTSSERARRSSERARGSSERVWSGRGGRRSGRGGRRSGCGEGGKGDLAREGRGIGRRGI
jgi:hypothetical protein